MTAALRLRSSAVGFASMLVVGRGRCVSIALSMLSYALVRVSSVSVKAACARATTIWIWLATSRHSLAIGCPFQHARNEFARELRVCVCVCVCV